MEEGKTQEKGQGRREKDKRKGRKERERRGRERRGRERRAAKKERQVIHNGDPFSVGLPYFTKQFSILQVSS